MANRTGRLICCVALCCGVSAAQDRASFRRYVEQGDRAYLAGNRKEALRRYGKALKVYETAASRLRFEPPPTAAGEGRDAEYTYLRLALSPYGRLRQDLLVRSFLLPKMEACKPLKRSRKKPVVYRVAAFVIRKTDLIYRDQGEERHEAATLDDDEVAAYKRAWRFAMDAVRAYAKGRFEVETTWFELEGATLRGVTQRSWKGLVQQRHLDPKKIEPRPDKLFKRATRHHDCVIFVWPRGKAAVAWGGGRIRLPCRNADLAVRGGILSISTDPRTCLHEFLHTIEENVGPLRAHGPKGKDLELFATQDIHDEVEWYAYVIKSVEDWKRAKYISK